jgi:hypothetical protein
MSEHAPVPAAGRRPRLSQTSQRILAWLAAALMFAGALMLIAGLGGVIAFPLIAIGAALLAIEEVDRRRRQR